MMSSDLLIPASTTSYSSSLTSMASLQLQPPATMEKLPNDVLSNIFIRLLAKQLAQMRSVSKPWNALLSDKSFIKSHLHHLIHSNDDVLLFFYDVSEDDLAEPFSAHPFKSPNMKLTDFIKSPVNFEWEKVHVIGSVNGLICFSNRPNHDDCALYIWNPSLSAISTIPPYFVPSPVNQPINLMFRFGYDPKADDYKIVKLATLLQPPNIMERVNKWLQVEVYSMRMGCWKLITQRLPSHITRISGNPDVCVDGHDGLLHWIGCIGEEKKEQIIVAFDLHVETFHEIPLPDSILEHNVGNRWNFVGVMAGKLCVMSCVGHAECEVWVMDEYGVVESWIKRHAFSQFRNIVPLGFTLCNQLLFEFVKFNDVINDFWFDDSYALYDPVAAKAKFFKLSQAVSQFVGYVDSLVWVAPGEREREIS